MDKALAVLEEMQSLGFKPTLEIYSVLIEGGRALEERGRLCKRVCIDERSVLSCEFLSPARIVSPVCNSTIPLIRTQKCSVKPNHC
jgi:hypothetical protein